MMGQVVEEELRFMLNSMSINGRKILTLAFMGTEFQHKCKQILLLGKEMLYKSSKL